VDAANRHDADAIAKCLHPDFESIQPIYPSRNFRGSTQVRRNWQAIFESEPGFRLSLVRSSSAGNTVWVELHGAGRDVEVAGVFIMGVEEDLVRWARVYSAVVEQPAPKMATHAAPSAADAEAPLTAQEEAEALRRAIDAGRPAAVADADEVPADALADESPDAAYAPPADVLGDDGAAADSDDADEDDADEDDEDDDEDEYDDDEYDDDDDDDDDEDEGDGDHATGVGREVGQDGGLVSAPVAPPADTVSGDAPGAGASDDEDDADGDDFDDDDDEDEGDEDDDEDGDDEDEDEDDEDDDDGDDEDDDDEDDDDGDDGDDDDGDDDDGVIGQPGLSDAGPATQPVPQVEADPDEVDEFWSGGQVHDLVGGEKRRRRSGRKEPEVVESIWDGDDALVVDLSDRRAEAGDDDTDDAGPGRSGRRRGGRRRR
jgi:hypothetical protein